MTSRETQVSPITSSSRKFRQKPTARLDLPPAEASLPLPQNLCRWGISYNRGTLWRVKDQQKAPSLRRTKKTVIVKTAFWCCRVYTRLVNLLRPLTEPCCQPRGRLWWLCCGFPSPKQKRSHVLQTASASESVGDQKGLSPHPNTVFKYRHGVY